MKINQEQIAKVGMIAVFLALIRCIGEFFRLQSIHNNTITTETVKPFMAGAMVCAVSCFIMTILFFYSRFKWVTVFAVLSIAVLFFLKFYYHL